MNIYILLFALTFTISSFAQLYSPKPFGVLTYVVNSTAFDLDGDGDNDILYGELGTTAAEVGWYKNNGFGVFGSKLVLATNFQVSEPYVTAGDIDNDGDLDIVYSSSGMNSSSVTGIVWHENLGGGVFGPQNNLFFSLATDRANIVKVVDLDIDGKMDIYFSAHNSSHSGWFRNLGGNIFSNQISLATGGYQTFLDDVDFDGDMDIIQNTGPIRFVENLGGVTFAPPIIIHTPPVVFEDVNIGDLDGDGDNDIISAARNAGEIAWYENQGGGVYGAKQIISSQATSAYKVYITDVDYDGVNDVLSLIGYGQNIVWYKNLGGGLFSTANTIFWHTDKYLSLLTADLDNDGDKEIVASPWGSSAYSHPIVQLENMRYHHNQISGKIFIDANQNGIRDSSDIGINQLGVISTPQSYFTYTYNNGDYFMNFSDTSGDYQVMPQSLQYWSIVTDSLLYHIHIDSVYVNLNNLDFGYYPDTMVNKVNTNLIGGFPRCNDTINYWIDIKNIGTTYSNGVIHLLLEDSIAFIGSMVTPDSVNGQNIYWHYDSLPYFMNEQLNFYVEMPDFNSLGDTLVSHLNVHVKDSIGNLVYISSDTLEQILTCAYDPNDKIASPSGLGNFGYIPINTSSIEYTIRFQNTGNDTAISITIEDQLDLNLDWNSLTPMVSSNSMKIDVNQFGKASFKFKNIMLPDSGADFLGSQGFVKFMINLKPNLPVGTQIFNTGHIYFDLNPAVITNTKVLTIDSLISVSIKEKLDYKKEILIYPNPTTDKLNILTEAKILRIEVIDISGKQVVAFENVSNILDVSNIKKGIYFLKIEMQNDIITQKFIKQ